MTCAYATPQCLSGCITWTGNGGLFPSVRKARARRTRDFFRSPEVYTSILVADVLRASSEFPHLAVRLNGTSDIRWEDYFPFDKFVDKRITFYDYTKHPLDERNTSIPNYHLVQSFDGTPFGAKICIEALSKDRKVAVVFDDDQPLPPTYTFDQKTWYRVVDGDIHDLVYYHDPGVVIGLRYKQDARPKSKGRTKKEDLGTFVQYGDVYDPTA